MTETTRLIYDILHATEAKNIPGLLMLYSYFEKAFDLLSWKFLYSALEFLGYSKNFIQWIRLFNMEITEYVIQYTKTNKNKTTAMVLSPAEHYRGRNTFSKIFTLFRFLLKSLGILVQLCQIMTWGRIHERS